jgi:hypothetical protein
LTKALVYGVYILETVQAILLLVDGIYISRSSFVMSSGGLGVQFLPKISPSILQAQRSAIFNIMWTAVPLLGGLGMFSQVNSGLVTYFSVQLHLSCNHSMHTAFVSLRGLGLSWVS